jgi:hypothetical protein
MEAVHTETRNGLVISIYPDSDCEHDLDCEAGRLVYFHSRGFLGEDWSRRDRDAVREDIESLRAAGGLAVPVFMYEHGGQTVSVRPFSCVWDSGQVGFWLLTAAQIDREWNGDRAAAESCVGAVVAHLDSWLRGDCYGFEVVDPEGGIEESCWGFVGDLRECLTEARAVADASGRADVIREARAREYEATRPDMYAHP